MCVTVYALIFHDRHHDPTVTVFADRDTALAQAEQKTTAAGWEVDELTPDMLRDRWLYASHHPTEIDTLHVVETDVVGHDEAGEVARLWAELDGQQIDAFVDTRHRLSDALDRLVAARTPRSN